MSANPPYSTTREAGGLLFTAGTLGRDEVGLAEGIDAQLSLAFDNLEALLSSRGLSNADVVRLVVYLDDMTSMEAMNSHFMARFDEPRPVRTTVEVAALPMGALVELEATANSRP